MTFRVFGRRFRTRVRTRREAAFWLRRDCFPEGDVYRWSLGRFMVTTMVDVDACHQG